MIIDVYKNILTISIKETYIDQFYNFSQKVYEKYSVVIIGKTKCTFFQNEKYIF